MIKQTIYCLGRHLNKEEDEEEKSDFCFFSFGLFFDNATTETGREAKMATVV